MPGCFAPTIAGQDREYDLMELTRGRLKATLIAGKIPETGEALIFRELGICFDLYADCFLYQVALSDRGKPGAQGREAIEAPSCTT